MGNISSRRERVQFESADNECLICLENISSQRFVQCIICKILLHTECESMSRLVTNRQFCLCPHCQQVGTLGGVSSTNVILN